MQAGSRSPQALEKISSLLRGTPWGGQLAGEDIPVVAGYMHLHEYRAGEHIFKEGDREDYLALVVAGEVTISKESANSREMVLVTLPEGAHFGEMSLIDSEPRSASALAKTRVALLVLERKDFEDILEKSPQTGLRMLRKIAAMVSLRLRETTGRMFFPR